MAEGDSGVIASALGIDTEDAESIVTSKIKSDLAARIINRYEKERVIEQRLKKKIMHDMLSSTRPDTTQFILDQAELALVNAREFIENFIGYDNSSEALMQLWANVQRLLDLLDPFQQLPGVTIPGIGDVTGIVQEFGTLQKVIWDSLPPEQREKIKKNIEDEKKKNKKPSVFETMGQELQDQADQTWEAVLILIDEISRIKEDLYMMCLEKSWGLIVKICKMLGIPVDVFPFNLLADLPEINKMSRDLRRGGKQMLNDAFSTTMAPLYMARAAMDSVPTTNEIKLSAVCMSLAKNEYETEYQKTVKKLADLQFRKARCEQQIKQLKKKLEATEKRIGIYEGSFSDSMQKMLEVVKNETQYQLNTLSSTVDRLKTAIPQQQKVSDEAKAKASNGAEIKKKGDADYNKAKTAVDKKNEETAAAQKAADEDAQRRRQYVKNVEQSQKTAAVEGLDAANPEGDGDADVLGGDHMQRKAEQISQFGTAALWMDNGDSEVSEGGND